MVLRALVATGQVSAIVDWADMLTLREEKYGDFVKAVETATQNLDFKALDELVRLSQP